MVRFLLARVARPAFDWFLDNLPTIFLFGLGGVAIAGCSHLSKSCDKWEAEQRSIAHAEGIEVKTDVYINGVGQVKVIQDKKRGVTCWHMGSDVTCLYDKEKDSK